MQEANKSRAGAGREEGERLFGSLLVDQVKGHDVSSFSPFGRLLTDTLQVQWNDAVQYLQADPRFNHPSLNPHDKRRMFEAHLGQLGSKRSNDLDQLFKIHATTLATTYDEIYPKIVDDFSVKRLGLQGQALEDRFKAWHRTRETDARRDFQEMLGENSFVEFWGRMRKKKLDEAALKVEADEMDEGEGLGDGGAADLTALAKQIDLNEIKSVLRVSHVILIRIRQVGGGANACDSEMEDTVNLIISQNYVNNGSGSVVSNLDL
jgi:transcription elongation regulator 1